MTAHNTAAQHTSSHDGAKAAHVRAAPVPKAHGIEVRALKPADLIEVLKQGLNDFRENPSHLLMLGLIYPIGAGIAFGIALSQNFAPLIFPALSGLALLGPFVAVVIYAISMRKERGEHFSWGESWKVIRSAHSWSVLMLGFFLIAIFGLWLISAMAIYRSTLGGMGYDDLFDFLMLTLTTSEGWTMIVAGCAVGFLFAAAVLACGVVSFPMLLDRSDIGAPAAVATSLRVTAKSPLTIALWGLILAGLMVLGTGLLLAGLAVVLPVLGHASWRLYRKAVGK